MPATQSEIAKQRYIRRFLRRQADHAILVAAALDLASAATFKVPPALPQYLQA
jgi:hypothetical protein